MAYSNWGAEVYLNGKPYPDRCDVPVTREPIVGFNKPGVIKFWAELIRLGEEGKLGNNWGQHPHHCVLGNGRVRLAGYKSSGSIWIDLEAKENGLGWDSNFEPEDFRKEIDLDGEKWAVEVKGRREPERVILTLKEPDGTEWRAISGYCLGEGHEDWY